MERGQVGALNYDMPILALRNQQQRQVAPQQQSGGGLDFELPDNLAGPREALSELYENYGLLKSVISDFERRGIQYDVPDYSQPGGGDAHQAYLAAQANVMYAAQKAANQRKLREQISEAESRGDVRYLPDYNPDEDWVEGNYMSTKLDPRVVEANKRTAETYYTDNEVGKANEVFFQNAVRNIQNDSTLSDTDKQYQIGALQRAIKQSSPSFYTDNNGSGSGSSDKSLMNLFQRVANHTRGVFPEGTYQNKIISGQQFASSNAFTGDSFGRKTVYRQDSMGNTMPVEVERKITDTIKDQSGQTYFVLDDGNTINVSSMNPDEVFRTLVESNSGKYGGTNSLPTFYNELSKSGLLAQDRTVPTGVVFGQGSAEQAQKAKPNIPGFERIQAALKADFDKVSNPDSNITINVPGSDGTIYKFSHSPEEGVHLSNWEEVGGYDKTNRPKNLTYQQYLDFVDQSGFWNKWLPEWQNKQVKSASTVPDNLTSRQQKAILQFTMQFKRDPSPTELQKIITKFK
ncbi:MAG TPA: hypothetical protein VD927_06345 [Chryseosolibacter sp.]|nr:hypothetical protein [Chryseosolibacter sp.]